MCILTGLITGIATAATAIGSAVSAAAGAISGFLGTSLATIGGTFSVAGSTIAGGTAAAGTVIGGTSITVGGALAGLGTAAVAGVGLATMYQSARASAFANQAQIDAVKQLTQETGKLEVNNTAKTIQENTGIKRTLSSLRVPLGITPQQKDTITQNVYGVDTNTVATATQNMTGLNIAA